MYYIYTSLFWMPKGQCQNGVSALQRCLCLFYRGRDDMSFGLLRLSLRSRFVVVITRVFMSKGLSAYLSSWI